MKKEFTIPSKKQPIYRLIRPLMKLFFKKPQIINLAGQIEEKSIILANHSAKSGAPSLDLYFPKKTCKWGAYEMFGNYKMRKAYLRDILYIKKCGAKMFKAKFLSSIIAMFNKYFYKGMWIFPSYLDMRLIKTLRNSCEVLDAGISVLIFPENSNQGYKDVLTEFFPGFVMLSEKYYKDRGIDLPIYPVYYSIKKRLMIIDKPMNVQQYLKIGYTRNEICEKFCMAINDFYYNYVNKRREE